MNNIDQALEWLKQGRKIKLTSWNYKENPIHPKYIYSNQQMNKIFNQNDAGIEISITDLIYGEWKLYEQEYLDRYILGEGVPVLETDIEEGRDYCILLEENNYSYCLKIDEKNFPDIDIFNEDAPKPIYRLVLEKVSKKEK